MLNFLIKKSILSLCVSVGLMLNHIALAAPVNYLPAAYSQLTKEYKAHAEWTNGENNDIQALGIGMAPIGSNHTRGRILARRAAIVDAQRNLLEYINGVSLDADTTVNNLTVENDTIRTQVSGIVRNAKIVKEGYNADGSYEVILSVTMYGDHKSLASVVIPKMVEKLPSQATSIYVETNNSEKVVSTITGIIVDAKGLGLEPTFSPVIYDSKGRIVYGLHKVDPSYVINHGMVEYANDISDKNRAGKNPLVVKAIGIRGGKNSVNKVNTVVSVEDGDKILSVSQSSDVLKNCAVVFVK